MRDVALKIPFGLLSAGGRWQSDNAGIARAQMLDDMLDDAILARAVSPLDQYEDAVTAFDQPALKLDGLDLQLAQVAAIAVLGVLPGSCAHTVLARRDMRWPGSYQRTLRG